MLFSTLLQAQAQIKTGRLRAVAVTTATRSRAAPELATMREAGVLAYEVTGWYGVVALARTRAIIYLMHYQLVSRLNCSPERSLCLTYKTVFI